MTDPGNALRTSEERQIAAELMASIDAHTLGGVHAVDRIQVSQPDDVDPGTLLSTVHSGSHTTGEEIGGSFAPTELADLESDHRETVARPNNTDDGTLTFSGGAGDDGSAVGTGNDVAAGGDDADRFLLSEAWGNGASDGGGDVGWTDVIELRDADGNILADGWSFDTASGSERQSVTVSGVPSDASLSAGTKNSDGTWTLTQEDFSGLTLVLAAGANPDLTLTATPTSTEVIGGDTTPAPENFDVPVDADADADAPTPTVNEVSGTEETATTEAPVLDAASFGSDELSSPNLQIPTDETTENPIRVARRLMPDSETESEFVSPVAPEILGGQELSNSPIRANEKLDENPAELNFGAIEPDAGAPQPSYNIVNGTAGNDNLSGTEFNDVINGLGGDDFLKALGGDDVVYGGDGNDKLWGQGGDDILLGGAGDDKLLGHGGQDTLEGGQGSDDLDGGGGIDTLSYANSSAGVTIDLDAGTASGGDAQGDTFAKFENVTGSEHDDSLTGDDGDNVLMGGGGADTLGGGAGDDYIAGGTGDDVAWGGDGADTFLLMETWGADTFHGGVGGAWTDTIELQDTNGNAPTDGWTFNITSGSVVSQGDGFIELSDDSAGTITMNDGTSLIFDGVEQFIW